MAKAKFVLDLNIEKMLNVEKIVKTKEVAVKYGFMDSNVEMYPNGSNTIEVALWNEYGTSKIPARPFFRMAWDKNAQKYYNKIDGYYDRVLNGQKIDPKKFMGRLGAIAVSDVKKSITELKEPPNAESTKKRKGSSNPLIHTEKMRDSVTFEIMEGVENEGIED